MQGKRSAREVIDTSLADNLWWERLCYGIVLVCVGTGAIGIVGGAARGDGLIAVSGAAFGALFWPAMRFAVSIRRENMHIRLYELPLAEAKTVEQKAALLREIVGLRSKGKGEAR